MSSVAKDSPLSNALLCSVGWTMYHSVTRNRDLMRRSTMKLRFPVISFVGLVTVLLVLALGITKVSSAANATSAPFTLWDPTTPVPASSEIPQLEDVRFSMIKRRQPKLDGFDWLHGVALSWHKGTLFSSFGHNKGIENTPTEINQGRRSSDHGRSWSPVELIAPTDGPDCRSHGVFLSHGGTLWLFLGRFGNDLEGRKYARLKTEAFVLHEPTDTWVSRGKVADTFWPCDEPLPTKDGNWIMGGMRIHPLNPGPGMSAKPAVAVSHGGDLTRWDTIEIPAPEDLQKIWGETTVLVDGNHVLAVARGASGQLCNALVSTSQDGGRTWTTLRRSNLPMTNSKAYGGTLSNGQRFLIGTMYQGVTGQRAPLTIAVTRPGEKTFCRIWRIRGAIRPEAGEKQDHRVAYPYAIEHDGQLYVGYSTGLGGNRNNGELAVFSISSLSVARASDQ